MARTHRSGREMSRNCVHDSWHVHARDAHPPQLVWATGRLDPKLHMASRLRPKPRCPAPNPREHAWDRSSTKHAADQSSIGGLSARSSRHRPLRQALRTTDGLEYALLNHARPSSDCPRSKFRTRPGHAGSRIRPPRPHERLGVILEQSINDAAAAFAARQRRWSGSLGADIAKLLGSDDSGRTDVRRMAMTT